MADNRFGPPALVDRLLIKAKLPLAPSARDALVDALRAEAFDLHLKAFFLLEKVKEKAATGGFGKIVAGSQGHEMYLAMKECFRESFLALHDDIGDPL